MTIEATSKTSVISNKRKRQINARDLSIRSTLTLLGLGVGLASVVMWCLWLTTPEGISNDVYYYWYYVKDVSQTGFSQVLPEYPLPAAILLWLPTLVTSEYSVYFTIFWVASAAICILIAFLLTFSVPLRTVGLSAAYLWLLAIVAAGPLSLFRYDLWPGLLVMSAMLSLYRLKDGWSGYIAWATALKLWPIVVAPYGFGGSRSLRRQTWLFAFWSVAIVVVSLLIGGFDRLISPLTWQGERGLHVESVLASAILVARLFEPGLWKAELSENNSVDFTGPGVSLLLILGTVLQIVFVFWCLYSYWKVIASGTKDIAAVCQLIVGTILVLMVINKVFSPQYILWLLPAACAMVSICQSERKPVPSWWIFSFVYIAAVTQLSYPTFYQMLFSGTAIEMLIATLCMLSRNFLMVLLAINICVRGIKKIKLYRP